eukprot:m.6741 g.6741  ORF g.6741 m.6741 type:complete len:610 (+) comp3576_c0_seq1:163-1992(+)
MEYTRAASPPTSGTEKTDPRCKKPIGGTFGFVGLTVFTAFSLTLLASTTFDSLYSFWFTSLGRISGIQRILFHGLLYAIMVTSPTGYGAPVGDSVLQADRLLERFPKYMVLPYHNFYTRAIFWNLSFVRMVQNITHVALLCCIVGFGGHLPILAAAFGVWYLGAVTNGNRMRGCSHRWILPSYLYLALTLSDCNHELSVDSFLSASFKSYPFRPCDSFDESGVCSVLASGFAARMCLIACVFANFSAGWAKIATAGWDWFKPSSCRFFVEWCRAETDFFSKSVQMTTMKEAGPIQKLMNAMYDNDYSLGSLMLFSVAVELASLPLLFIGAGVDAWWATVWIVLFTKFHLGVYMMMYIDFFPHNICYLMMLPIAMGAIPATSAAAGFSLMQIFSLIIGFSFVAILTVVTFFTICAWPFNCYPLFTTWRKGFEVEAISVPQLRQISDESPFNAFPSLRSLFEKLGFVRYNDMQWSAVWITLVVSKNLHKSRIASASEIELRDVLNEYCSTRCTEILVRAKIMHHLFKWMKTQSYLSCDFGKEMTIQGETRLVSHWDVPSVGVLLEDMQADLLKSRTPLDLAGQIDDMHFVLNMRCTDGQRAFVVLASSERK